MLDVIERRELIFIKKTSENSVKSVYRPAPVFGDPIVRRRLQHKLVMVYVYLKLNQCMQKIFFK